MEGVTQFPVLTIGHSNHSMDALLALLKQHGVTAVADVRSAPYSRYMPQFNHDALQGVLEAGGIEYVYLGGELGGRPADRSRATTKKGVCCMSGLRRQTLSTTASGRLCTKRTSAA